MSHGPKSLYFRTNKKGPRPAFRVGVFVVECGPLLGAPGWPVLRPAPGWGVYTFVPLRRVLGPLRGSWARRSAPPPSPWPGPSWPPAWSGALIMAGVLDPLHHGGDQEGRPPAPGLLGVGYLRGCVPGSGTFPPGCWARSGDLCWIEKPLNVNGSSVSMRTRGVLFAIVRIKNYGPLHGGRNKGAAARPLSGSWVARAASRSGGGVYIPSSRSGASWARSGAPGREDHRHHRPHGRGRPGLQRGAGL